jgi:predicted phage gp36 major capsid-like protein
MRIKFSSMVFGSFLLLAGAVIVAPRGLIAAARGVGYSAGRARVLLLEMKSAVEDMVQEADDLDNTSAEIRSSLRDLDNIRNELRSSANWRDLIPSQAQAQASGRAAEHDKLVERVDPVDPRLANNVLRALNEQHKQKKQ